MGKRSRNIFEQVDIDTVPYMMTLGGQTFASAFANMWRALCSPGGGGRCTQLDVAGSGGLAALIASVPNQPFLETALGGPSSTYCSGFTSYVYRQVGKSIPRTAEAQRAASTKVSNPVPGDLIFFGYPAYHVGIYAGGNMMYDSPRTGKTTGLHVIWTQTNVSYGRF